MPLLLLKSISRNRCIFLQVIIIHSNQKHTTCKCKCKTQLTIGNVFLMFFVGMSSSINDARMLRLSSVYKKATQGYLFNENTLHDGIRPYIIDDKGYLLLPWLMVLHQQMGVHHYVFQALFNKQLNHARVVVENNFKILKKTF